ncbi:MAG: hypothetical protein IIT82_11620 [Selenomonas sp.]|nr:hypothetical protein [Selenomonas sp.]
MFVSLQYIFVNNKHGYGETKIFCNGAVPLGGNGGGGADHAHPHAAQGGRGWGMGVGYMLAANTNLDLTYYRLKPYDENAAGFTKYDDVAYAALTYSF